MRPLTAVFVVALLLAQASEGATRQPCHGPPHAPVHPVADPPSKNVPRDTAVFIYADLYERFRLRTKGGKVVAVTHLTAKREGRHTTRLLRLVPKKHLAANTWYEVQRSVWERDYAKPDSPLVWKPYKDFATFRTAATIAGKARPALKRAALRWGKYTPRGYSTDYKGKFWSRGGGRPGILHLTPGGAKPTLVDLQLTLVRRGKKPWTSHFGHRFALRRGIVHVGPCRAGRANVRHGRYRLVITPYSASGVAGKPLSIQGKIR